MPEVPAGELGHAAMAITSYRTVSPSVAASGLRTHQLRFENLGDARLPRPAEEFLAAGRLRRWNREDGLSASAYFADPTVTALAELDRETGPGDAVALPASVPVVMELGEAVHRRRSVRTFSGDAVGLPELATVLRHAGGITAEGDVELMRGGTAVYRFRTAPSGGGLYPVEIWCAALDVDGLERGLYRYRAPADALAPAGGANAVTRVLDAMAVPEDLITLGAASALLLLVGRPWRSMRKYGPRGMRFVLQEAGAIAQNTHLTATALGLGSVDCASFYDDEINSAIGADGTAAAVLHTIVVGWQG
ncbi:SagB family peptide dehydrogenase [Streptomyces hiroshimensis]|uniref:Streptolysin associated protein SagB n=1 Tax=Streptomyces hiroshimensis TaxID=66424 RepID=A0ABQ2Y9A6_9ACTN|nr:SagB family peptide dehydrogenase [Streptomyces hiroshimensis]GGX74284.1 streptolysin associated protein SagB [Streptomyces hiroshimensis]